MPGSVAPLPTVARRRAGLDPLPPYVTYRPRPRVRRSLANGAPVTGRDTLGAVAQSLADRPEVSRIRDDQERAAALVSLIRREHPERDWTTRSVQRAAARALRVEEPADLIRRGRAAQASGSRRRAKGRARARRAGRKVTRVRVAPASTFGAIIAQGLGLVALYWVVRSAGAVGRILDAGRSAVRWLVAPVGWSRPRT
jgi:hypothetical protein